MSTTEYRGHDVNNEHTAESRERVHNILDTLMDRDSQGVPQDGTNFLTKILGFFGLSAFGGNLNEALGNIMSGFETGQFEELGAMPNGGALDGIRAPQPGAPAPTAPTLAQAPGLDSPSFTRGR